MWIANAWYVAAWTHEIEPGRIHARTIIDQPLVLYRTSEGEIVALEDRCPHRFAPLSIGRLEGDELRCMYHGLKFAPDGRCIEIPGQKLIPQSACVRRYPVAGRRQLGLGLDGRRRQRPIPPPSRRRWRSTIRPTGCRPASSTTTRTIC